MRITVGAWAEQLIEQCHLLDTNVSSRYNRGQQQQQQQSQRGNKLQIDAY